MKRIVVLGGGFGGLATAQRLDRRFRNADEIEIDLISDSNYVVYTPMLADVAGGTIEPRHAVPPLRAFLKKARFLEASVTRIDVANRTVHGTVVNGDQTELTYDYLVIALGCVTNFGHATGAAEHCLALKDLLDAFRVRNRALTMLEWANTIPASETKLRQEILTFVVAGGGFSGVEGIAALEDLLHGALRFYPSIRPEEIRLILAPHGKRLLTEVDARLGDYVVEKFSQRTIDVRLGVGIDAVTDRSATLTTGEEIPTRTVIWTAGIKINPVLHDVDLPKNKHGALLVDGHLNVHNQSTIFALGDCAAVPLSDGQGYYAPTAQNAIREGPVAAANIIAALSNSPYRRTFSYKPIGSLASLGQRQAVAQIGDLQLSGLPAWFAWRAIYLAKMPTLADKVRIGMDWITDLFAPVDTVQLPIVKENLKATLERMAVGESFGAAAPGQVAGPATAPSAPVSG